MFKNLKLKTIVFSGICLVLSFTVNAGATPINTTAEVLGAITVTEQTPLNFGQFTVGGSGGVVTFDAGGTISASGDVVLLGSEAGGVARLDTAGAPLATTVTVTVTGTTLTSGANSMAIVGNCKGLLGALGADNGDCTFLSNGLVDDDVQIGGKLTVGANQPSGTYTGTLEVTASF